MSTQTMFVKAGATSVTAIVQLEQKAAATAPGDPILSLAYNTGSLIAYYKNGATGALTSISLVTQTATGAYSSGGFVLLSDTNAPGGYRLDLPDAAIPSTVGTECNIWITGAANLRTHELKLVASAQVDVASTAGSIEIARITGTASGGTSRSIKFPGSTITTQNCPVGGTVRIVSGTAAFQFMPITSVTAAGGYVTEAFGPISWVWPVTNPNNTSVYQIEPGPGVAPVAAPTSPSGKLQVDLQEILSVQQVGTGVVADNYRPTGAPIG